MFHIERDHNQPVGLVYYISITGKVALAISSLITGGFRGPFVFGLYGWMDNDSGIGFLFPDNLMRLDIDADAISVMPFGTAYLGQYRVQAYLLFTGHAETCAGDSDAFFHI